MIKALWKSAVGIAAAGLCAAGMTGAASAAVTVFGNTDARECYFQTSLPFGQSESTVDLCTRALKHGGLNPRDKAATLVNRGIVYTNLGKLDDALADFEAALGIKPSLAEAYLNRGNTFIFKRQFQAAVKDYDRALELDTRQAFAAYYNRGLAHEALRDLDSAYADFLKAQELAPEWELVNERIRTYQEKYVKSGN